MNNKRINEFYSNPIIAAVRNKEDLQDSFQTEVSTVFILHSSILNVKELVDMSRENKKNVLIHVDMVDGLGNDSEAVKFVADLVKPDGIISTKTNIIKYAKEYGLYTVQRCFCVDSAAIRTGIRSVEQISPDAVELLPGVVPRVVSKFISSVGKHIITGGMVQTKDDIIASLNAGAIAVSTSCKELWNM